MPRSQAAVNQPFAVVQRCVDATLYYGEGLVHGCLRARHQVAEVDRLFENLLGFMADKL